jgi:PAS domain S-box-containing protein
VTALIQKPGITLDQILQGTVELLPPAWQYPKITGARLVLEDQEFVTARFQKTSWIQACDIVVQGEPLGCLQVSYLEERPQRDEGPFLRKERDLLEGIAARLGRIIERIRAQAALQQSESRLRLAHRLAQLGHWDWFMETNDLHWSPEVFQIFGRDPDHFRPTVESFEAAIHPDDLAAFLAERERALAERRDISIEHRIVRPDGAIRHVHELAEIIRDEQGRIVSVLGTVQDITKRKAMEEALRESQANLSALIENTDGCIWSLDRDYCLIVSNSVFHQCVRAARGQPFTPGDNLLAQDFARTVLDEWREYYDRALSGERFSVEIRSRFIDPARYLEYRFSPLHAADGSVAGVTVFGRDVTDRRQAEAALQESEARYRSLFEDTPVGLYSSTPDGQMLAANAALVEMLAYPDKESLLQVHVADLYLHPAERARWQLAMQASDGLIRNMAVRLRRHDGRAIWVEDTSRAVRDDEGRIVRYDGAVEDISERKRAEDALHESERRYQGIAANIPGAVCQFQIEPDGAFTVPYMSVSGEALFERPLRELTESSRLFDDIHPDDMAPFLESVAEAAQHMSLWTHDFRIVKSGDRVKWLRGLSKPRRLPDGTILWDGVLLDITERKRAEQGIQASLREKEVLLKEIHHRVKNNLQVVSSMLDMQSLSTQSPEAIEALEDSRHRVRTMAFVHERLYQAEDLSSIDVREYLESLTSYLLASYESSARGIRLDLQIEDLGLDLDSAIAIGLIANELVSNVLKHAFPPAWQGEGRIGVEFSATDEDRVALRVTDNGVGLPPDLDLEGAESLGLRLVSMLAQQLQGTLELDRSTGTTFRITFPTKTRSPSKKAGQG